MKNQNNNEEVYDNEESSIETNPPFDNVESFKQLVLSNKHLKLQISKPNKKTEEPIIREWNKDDTISLNGFSFTRYVISISTLKENKRIVNTNIPNNNKEGIYCFVCNEDLSIDLKVMLPKLTNISLDKDAEKLVFKKSSAAPINLYDEEQLEFNSKVKLKKGEIIYIGKGNFKSRLLAHSNDNLTSTGALYYKLRGIEDEQLSFYISDNCQPTDMNEQKVKGNYKIRFGK